MSAMIAALPMYDWPEARAEVDAKWAAIRDRLVSAGVDAPEALVRRNADMPPVPGGISDRDGRVIAPDPATLPPDELDLATLWRHPALLFSQACWGPIRAQGLLMQVSVVGQPDYSDVEGGLGRRYRSALLMRMGEAGPPIAPPGGGAASIPPPGGGAASIPLDLLRGRALAYNEIDSMSGMVGLAEDIAGHGPPDRFFSVLSSTGGHRASIRAVAEGRADVCVVDCRSWDLAQRFEPAAKALAVVGWTAARMGLPYVSARGLKADHAAIRGALAAHPTDAVSLRGRMVESGIAAPSEIVGCTAEEIAALEARHDRVLPDSYRAVLALLGRASGRLVDRNEFEIHLDRLDRVNADGRAALLDAALDGIDLAGTENAFFIATRQRGDPTFIHGTGGADSAVYTLDDDGMPVRIAASVWDWIGALCVDAEFFIGAGLR